MSDTKKAHIAAEALSGGVYAAALTPMHEDFSCNCEALAEHCQDLMQRGCQGVVLFGTTGEGSSFSVAEREQIVKKVIQLGVDPRKLLIGISCCALSDAIKLARLAIEQQCAAVLIAPPFFYKKVEEQGVINFYKNIIQSVNHSNLKIVLYHIPQYSGVPITISVIKALREEFPTAVVGIKESEGNLPFTKEILASFADFKVYVGHELHISEAVQLGAAGAISGIANAFPELICSLYEFGKDQRHPNQNALASNIVHSIKKYPTFPAIKSMVESHKGAAWHVVRPPLVALNAQQRQALMDLIKN